MRRRSFRRRGAADLSALAIAMSTQTRDPQMLIRVLMGALLLSLALAAFAVGAAQAASSAPNIGIPLTPTTVAPGGAPTTAAPAAGVTPTTTGGTTTPTTTPATSAAPTTAQGVRAATTPLNPGLRFTQGTVQFLPEYDSADVLVIIDYQLVPGAKTPFTFQFRVPANARMTGYALVDTNGSFDYSRPAPTVVQGDEWDVVSVAVPKNKPVHIEYYYDPGLVLSGQRGFPVVFDPPAAIDQLTLQVQEPRRATGFAVSPGFAQTTQGSDGFAFREESRTGVQPGQPIAAQVAYGKPDANPSLPPASGTGGANSAGTTAASGGSGGSGYLLWVLLAVAAAVAGIVAYRMPSRRPAIATSPSARTAGRARSAVPPQRPARPSATSRGSTLPPWTPASAAGSGRVASIPRSPHDLEIEGGPQRFCTQCGDTFAPTDRFCSQCGEAREGA